MITSLALMSIFKSPTIPLSEICDRFLSLSYEEAMRRAARGKCSSPPASSRTSSAAAAQGAPSIMTMARTGKLRRGMG